MLQNANVRILMTVAVLRVTADTGKERIPEQTINLKQTLERADYGSVIIAKKELITVEIF